MNVLVVQEWLCKCFKVVCHLTNVCSCLQETAASFLDFIVYCHECLLVLSLIFVSKWACTIEICEMTTCNSVRVHLLLVITALCIKHAYIARVVAFDSLAD